MKKQQADFNARSKQNGIIFYSNTLPSIGLQTFFDNSGNIRSQLVPKTLDKIFDFAIFLEVENNLLSKWSVIIFNILLIITSIVASIFYEDFAFLWAALVFCFFVSSKLFCFINTCRMMKLQNESGMSTAKFHSAEHMVLNAYRTLQRIPSLDEIKTFSRFSRNCGSMNLIYEIVLYTIYSLIILLLMPNNLIIYIIASVLTITLMPIFLSIGWLDFLQVFVTSIPSDMELKLAIEGLKRFLIVEERLKNAEDLPLELVKLSLDIESTLPSSID